MQQLSDSIDKDFSLSKVGVHRLSIYLKDISKLYYTCKALLDEAVQEFNAISIYLGASTQKGK